MNLETEQILVGRPDTTMRLETEDLVARAVQDFHKKRAHRMHIQCAFAGIATLPNRLVRNPEWLQTILRLGALLVLAAIVIAVIRYFYFKGRPETLVLPDGFLAAHPQLLERIRENRGNGNFQPMVLADLMAHGVQQ